MARWTPQQVAQLAPDDKSVTAARKLARPGPWSDTGSTDTLVWGKCQGSGATPYQVSVDLTGPAFTCSCPSRKFPCKHGLALLLLWVEGDGSVADVDAPADFAADWVAGRQARATSRGAANAAEAAERVPVDPEAQARRLEERMARMTVGLADFERWVEDLVRQGLAAARPQPYAFWDDAAARLVDAQLPGLAERIRQMGSDIAARPDWPDHLLAEAGRWWAAAQAWKRRDQLDERDLADLRVFLGWSWATAEVRSAPPVVDRWVVLGVHRTDDGRLQEQRTWLRGETTGETVRVLDFATVGGTLGVARVVGTVIDAALAPYPGTAPRRALLPEDAAGADRATSLPGCESIREALARTAGWLGDNPWPDRLPLALHQVRVVAPETDVAAPSAHAVDGRGDALPLVPDAPLWPLLAWTGGEPVDLFGELEDGELRPLTVGVDRDLVAM
jgi:hypothetical protein